MKRPSTHPFIHEKLRRWSSDHLSAALSAGMVLACKARLQLLGVHAVRYKALL